MNVWKKQFMIGKYASGNLLLKVLVRESHLDTNATTSCIRTQLSSLDKDMMTISNDIGNLIFMSKPSWDRSRLGAKPPQTSSPIFSKNTPNVRTKRSWITWTVNKRTTRMEMTRHLSKLCKRPTTISRTKNWRINGMFHQLNKKRSWPSKRKSRRWNAQLNTARKKKGEPQKEARRVRKSRQSSKGQTKQETKVVFRRTQTSWSLQAAQVELKGLVFLWSSLWWKMWRPIPCA